MQKTIEQSIEQKLSPKQQALVGITQYISDGKPILAVTKYQITDFIVNQIDTNGNLVYLKNQPDTSKPPKKPQIKQAAPQMSQKLKKQIQEVFNDQQITKQVELLYERIESGQKACWEFEVKGTFTKEERTRIHNFVRENLYQIESTVRDGTLKLIYNKKLKKMDPSLRHKYTYFKLYKQNIDTLNATLSLSKILYLSPKLFSTAGLKDKRGVTTQLVSVYNTPSDKLYNFYSQAYRNREIWIDEFEEGKSEKLAIGHLTGNQFGLILRLLNQVDTELIFNRVNSFKEIGMINYFGLQRFGQFSTKTHELGIKVVQKQWKKLIEGIILSDCGNEGINQKKKDIFNKGQFYRAENQIPSKYKIEKLIFKGLAKNSNNYCNIFETLPRSIKTLYLHALQSYIWNRMTSQRIKQYGLKLVIGDLVGIKKTDNIKKSEQPVQDEQDIEELEPVDEEDFDIIVITQENRSSFTIYDMVVPLIGPGLALPQNCILHPLTEKQLAKLYISTKDFYSINSKGFCFKGQFRKMIVKPMQLQFSILKHSDKKSTLQSSFYMKGKVPEYEQGDFRSLQLSMQLPKSSYATMAIRQILHLTSEWSIQMELNKMYDAR